MTGRLEVAAWAVAEAVRRSQVEGRAALVAIHEDALIICDFPVDRKRQGRDNGASGNVR